MIRRSLNRINCKVNHGDFSNGCSVCGGFGTVLEEVRMDCGHIYWAKPGVHTIYEGKRFHSFDGVEIIAAKTGFMCFECYQNNLTKSSARLK